MFENIKRVIKWSLSKSPSIQVLHQKIREGVLVCADSANAGGVQNYGKHADILIILERSLYCIYCVLFWTAICSFIIINILYDD